MFWQPAGVCAGSVFWYRYECLSLADLIAGEQAAFHGQDRKWQRERALFG
jgi:hypothetical protein